MLVPLKLTVLGYGVGAMYGPPVELILGGGWWGGHEDGQRQA